MHAATGHITKNWPIRCALYEGPELAERSQLSGEGEDGGTDPSGDGRLQGGAALLVATGSADGDVRVFDLTAGGQTPPCQHLRGHTDRVYGVHFDPAQPVLASGSADATVRIWSSSRLR